MLELARMEDREAVNELALQAHSMHVAWRPDLYDMVDELYSAERMQSAITTRSLYVAKIDGMVVGYVSAGIRSLDYPGAVIRKIMMIDELVVHELCRGRGIGTSMMMDIRALAKAFRCTDLQLTVYPQNDDAVGFYQKCGLMIQNLTMQCKL
ncbi:MAG: GNAT family N-acetyltransferase [Oscillospiraceae bacterium]